MAAEVVHGEGVVEGALGGDGDVVVAALPGRLGEELHRAG